MNYIGDFDVGALVEVWFNSFTSDDPSASVTMSDFVDTDVYLYKDDDVGSPRNNAAGIAVDIDAGAVVGVHKVTITTADNTVANFYEAGHDYSVVMVGTTIDAGTVNACIATFSIANRRTAGQMCVSSIEGLTSQSLFTLTAGEASANDDAYNGCVVVVTDQVTKIQKAVGHISDYTGATRTVTLHAVPLQTGYTMAIGDSVEIFATAAFANVNTVLQLVPISVANIETACEDALDTKVGIAGLSLDALPNQTMDITGSLSGSVGSVTGAVGSVTGAVGSVAGNVDGGVTGAVGSVTGHTPQTGDNFTRIGPHGDNLTSVISTGTVIHDSQYSRSTAATGPKVG